MAKFGLKGFWVANFSENETTHAITYTNGKKVAKAVNVSTNVQYDEAKLYADNGLDDSIKTINTMEMTVTPNGIDYTNLATLIGLGTQTVNINGTDVEVVATSAYDEGAAVGFGYITQDRITGSNSYVATIAANVKFSPSDSEELNTRGETAEFTTPSYTGSCYKTSQGYYKFEQKFTTEAAAEAWITTQLNVA